MNKKRVLLVKPWRGSSFIEQDGRILEKRFVLYEAEFSFRRLFSILTDILSRRVDGVFVWFVFWWAFPIVLACRLSGVKVILVPSGVDVADYPEIEYGTLGDLKVRMLVKFALNEADLVLPVSDFTRKEVLKISSPRKIKVIYNGVDFQRFRPVLTNKSRENIVLTVGAINRMNLMYKRFDLFVECAKLLPEVKFVIIGKQIDDTRDVLRQRAPSNVSFIGFLPEEDLIRCYSRAKVYAQFSHAEAFGCALVEAMGCECVPVVVNRGALPEVVGDAGFYAPYNDPKAMAETIQRALNSPNGHDTRKRVVSLFSLERREMELTETLMQTLES